MNLKKILISNDIYKDRNKITKDEIVIYLIIDYICAHDNAFDCHYISLQQIFGYMYGDINPCNRIRTTISDALNSLIEKKIIDGKKLSSSIYLINASSLEVDDDSKFALVYIQDIVKILRSDYKNKFAIIEYYVWMMGSRADKIGFMKMQYFEYMLNLSHSTIISYNKILEDLQIIYIKHSFGGPKDEDDNYVCVSNKYCHYSDRNLLFDAESDNGITTRERKSLAAKYNQMLQGRHYSATEEHRILQYITEYNEEEDKKVARMPGYEPQYKDTSIFSYSLDINKG